MSSLIDCVSTDKVEILSQEFRFNIPCAGAVSMSKKMLAVVFVVVAVGSYAGYQYWLSSQSALPQGIASGNGRVEAKLVDIAAREPLRVKKLLVNEGALVQRGDVVGRDGHFDSGSRTGGN